MPFAAGVLVALVGAGHLVAWLSGAMASLGATTITVKANASLCLLLAGLSLALLAFEHPPLAVRFTARLCAAVVLVLGAGTLVEHVARIDLGVDQLLATEPPGAAAVVSPNRMGPPASVSFTVLGIALLLLTRRDPAPRYRTAHQALGLVALVASMIPIIGYLYGVNELYGIARYTGIAWPAAVSILVLAVGVLSVRPRVGFVALLTADDPGGVLVRRLLPAVILIPLVLGYFRLAGERAGWFGAGTGTSLMMLIFMLALSTLVMAGGRWVGRAEFVLRQNEDATRRRFEEIQTIYDSAHVGLCVLDRDLRYQRVNQRLAEMNGFPAADHLGKTVGEMVPSLAPLVREVAERIFRTGQGVTDIEFTGTTIAEPDVQRTWIEQWLPLKDASGRVIAINVVVEDVTDRKRSEEALREANTRLSEADRRKDEFIAILSHELRNPLAPIRYALPLVERELLGDTANRAMAVIHRQVDHLARLVDDFLDISRVTRGKIELRREEVTLASILQVAIESASPGIVAGRHTLTTTIPEEAIWMSADPGRIAQAITNLLNNSARYTPSGGRIALEAERCDNEAVIRVRDNGIGIDPEVLPSLFEMFRQVSRADRPQGGLGVGLAFARRLVEMHEGSIEARSAGIGHGSEFVVRLPVLPDAKAGEAREDLARTTPAGRRLKVLVADDNADLVQMLAIVLESAGHEVRKALDGRSAISLALAYRPDVALIDIGMPEVGGLDVARALRQHAETAGMRLVALTGWGQAQDRERTAEAGFDHHLTKPTDPQQIQALLAQIARELAAPGLAAPA